MVHIRKFDFIRKLEKSYLYFVLMLPLAAVFLRLSSIQGLHVFSQYGETIYSHLPLLYALAIAYGFSKDHSGIAVFSASIGYVLFEAAYLEIAPTNDMNILGGVMIGVLTAWIFNKTQHFRFNGSWELFNEKRFMPIVISVASYVTGLITGQIWPTLGNLVTEASILITKMGPAGTFIYGVLNRLLLPLGLHHNLNQYVWFEYGQYQGVTGDLNRFFAGDPSAGTYMSGFYIVMMFGLPAIVLAFYHHVNKENRNVIKGIYIIGAGISIFTGITEPVELLFLFLLPKLYLMHAFLTGMAMAVADVFNYRVGFNFSAGFIDFASYFRQQPGNISLLGVGLVFGLIYYFMTKFYIARRPFTAPGDYVESDNNQKLITRHFIHGLTEAFGGYDNIRYIQVKFTRFEFRIQNQEKVNQDLLESLEDTNIIKVSSGNYQIITGNQGKYLREIIDEVFQDKVL